jgi:nanoRNase/pAp phosphatase (c-di-AMP/oligoRNAs hydrolase)
MYKWPGKIIIVAYVHEGKASISLRGKKVRDYLEKALEKSGGRGGGHEEACAANIKSEDLHKFVEEIRKQAQ